MKSFTRQTKPVSIIVLLTLLLTGLSLALVGSGCSESASQEEVKVSSLLVQSATAKIGETVAVLGAGLTEGDTVEIQIRMAADAPPVGVTHVLNPAPEVNEFGAFYSELKLTGFVAGIYTVELHVNQEIVATAPLRVTS